MATPLIGQELAFPEFEYEQRLHAVQKDLSKRNLAAGILFDPENIYWLTGFQSIGYFTFQCLLVLKDKKPILLSRQPAMIWASHAEVFRRRSHRIWAHANLASQLLLLAAINKRLR